MMLFRSKLVLFAAIATMAVLPSSIHAATAQMNIFPSGGGLSVGVPFQVQVTLSDLNPADSLFAYTFDLAFDPAVFQAQSVLDGTIFDPGGFYTTGTIDNIFGTINLEAGLDLNQTFLGTGGLLGTVMFLPISEAIGTTISVQNVSLQTLDGALNNEADVDPGTLPTATFDVVAPEPATLSLIPAALCILAAVELRKRFSGATR